MAETSGEDVYLSCEFAAARVRGFQGGDLTAPDSLLTTPKHFAAYGAISAGLDYNFVDMAPQTLRDVHLPPFKAALDAGALTLMSSFNDINGVPASAVPAKYSPRRPVPAPVGVGAVGSSRPIWRT